MRGDFTQFGFDPAKQFSRVLMQQGRVQLDRDWNDRQEIDRYLERNTAADSLGGTGAPALGPGFTVGLAPGGSDLSISAGRLYAGGIMCELLQSTTLWTQPDLPFASGGFTGPAWPTQAGRYLVYLDVWERDVSALEDPSIAEPGLGGPDTTTRTRVVTQIKLLQTGSDTLTETLGSLPVPFPPAAVQPGALAAATLAASDAPGPCVLPPQASYTALTNQLYRVEIHTAGALGVEGATAPTFKWSRDDGSVVTALTATAPQPPNLFVTSLGPDDPRGFAAGQVVEIIDDRTALSGQAGTLLLIAGTSVTQQGPVIQIDTTANAIPAVDQSRAVPVLLRRWDQPGSETALAVTAVLDDPIALEAGIQIAFQAGNYQVGDYWTIPARTAINGQTGNLIWPQSNGGSVFVGSAAAPHRYVPLALVAFQPASPATPGPSGQFTLIEDCRSFFAPAAGRLGMFRVRAWGVSGLPALQDGQAIQLDSFAQGLLLAIGAPLDATSVSAASIQLLADLPVTGSQLQPNSGVSGVIGTQSVALAVTMALPSPQQVVIAPTPSAVALLNTVLGNPVIISGQTDFAGSFTTYDAGAAAVWTSTPAGTVQQTNATCATTGNPLSKTAPSVAISNAGAQVALSVAGVSFSAGSTYGDGGMVFNFVSKNDFWVFYQSLTSESFGETEGGDVVTTTLAYFQNEQATPVYSFSGGQQFPPSDANGIPSWQTDLDIVVTSSGPVFHCLITYANGETQTFTISNTGNSTNFPTGIIPSGLGIMAAEKGDLTFTRLQWTDVTDVSGEGLPLGVQQPLVATLRVRRSALRSAAQAAAPGAMPSPAAPEPDFSASFLITPSPPTYYGYTSGASAAALWLGPVVVPSVPTVFAPSKTTGILPVVPPTKVFVAGKGSVLI